MNLAQKLTHERKLHKEYDEAEARLLDFHQELVKEHCPIQEGDVVMKDTPYFVNLNSATAEVIVITLLVEEDKEYWEILTSSVPDGVFNCACIPLDECFIA